MQRPTELMKLLMVGIRDKINSPKNNAILILLHTLDFTFSRFSTTINCTVKYKKIRRKGSLSCNFSELVLSNMYYSLCCKRWNV